jgi:hypothetical protein
MEGFAGLTAPTCYPWQDYVDALRQERRPLVSPTRERPAALKPLAGSGGGADKRLACESQPPRCARDDTSSPRISGGIDARDGNGLSGEH